ncbi:hypothetical protein PYCC9005_002577 [Savitreella phatthalungensis]
MRCHYAPDVEVSDAGESGDRSVVSTPVTPPSKARTQPDKQLPKKRKVVSETKSETKSELSEPTSTSCDREEETAESSHKEHNSSPRKKPRVDAILNNDGFVKTDAVNGQSSAI